MKINWKRNILLSAELNMFIIKRIGNSDMRNKLSKLSELYIYENFRI
jgi:hypothetical protein